MKLAYLSDSVVPSHTANSVQVMRMCAAFAQEGLTVTLVARRGREEGGDSDFEYYAVPKIFAIQFVGFWERVRGRAWFYAFQAGASACLARADLAFCRCPYSAMLAAAFGVPTVYEAHSVPASGSKRDWILSILPRLPGFCGFVAITHALARDLSHRYGWASGSIHVAADGADEAVAGAVCRKLSRQGRLCVGFVGHLYPGKGMETVLPLAAQCPEMDFHIVGGTDEWLAHWKSKASAMELTNVVFHGHVSPASTGSYVAAFDVVLAPLQRRVAASGGDDIAAWTSPMKIFEYMSQRSVIVASALPVLQEVLVDGVNAILCEPEDIGRWSTILRRLANDEAERLRLGRAACRDFLENYTWRGRARKILARFEVNHMAMSLRIT